MESDDEIEIFEEKPLLYSREAIGIWSILFSPFFGTILFAYNLKAIGNSGYNVLIVLAGLVWTFAVRILLAQFLPVSFTLLFIANGIGSMILTTFVWNHFIGKYTEYEKRPVWKPVLITLGICFFLLGLGLMAGRGR